MASVHARKNRAGIITSYQVKWREGGARTGKGQSETFEDIAAAEIFQAAVNAAGQQWPHGWMKGRGYVAVEPVLSDEARFRFRGYATRAIDRRTGISPQYRKDCHRDLEKYIYPTFGDGDVRSAEHFSGETVKEWVRVLEQTRVTRGAQLPNSPNRKLMSPKTIRNLHGLLSSILQEAVTAEPPLRNRNPCELTRLGRTDDDGGADDGGVDDDSDEDEEDICFLTPQEVAGIRECMTRPGDQLLLDVKYGSGMRFGEITALAPKCIIDRATKPKIRVRRAWKKNGKGGYFMGKPKSKLGRRSIRVSTTVMAALVELGLGTLDESTLFWTGDKGQRLHASTFNDRWHRAVRRAKAAGLLSAERAPTPHDLRHSHAAALISAGHGLTYVQRRLGHESIKTTSDLYGHLLPEADDDAMETIEATLSGERPRLRAV
ncbi:tyrosine-type recombinase/integrase [Streptomyces albipurpureus]|uniref:Site-specific integrase n=1 Tax=Streptomyces albipurpureus TaxID=2897419 RepID=A0ABT0UNK8_9ACTN|nr:site-specific integrase [Streptomyces sp. CWNU-1]MCM2390214.1 site-specific integrase [Streptomyces sp. CWNU-1]